MKLISKIAIAAGVLLAGFLLSLPFRKPPAAPLRQAGSDQVTGLAPISAADVATQKLVAASLGEVNSQGGNSPVALAAGREPGSEHASIEMSGGGRLSDNASTHGTSQARTAYLLRNEDGSPAREPSPPRTFAVPSSNPLPPHLPRAYQHDLDRGAALERETGAPRGMSTIRAQPTTTQEIVHRVRDGDTLARLAARYLGNPARYLELYELNRHQLSSPELLPIGTELRIPSRDDGYD